MHAEKGSAKDDGASGREGEGQPVVHVAARSAAENEIMARARALYMSQDLVAGGCGETEEEHV